MAEVDVLGKPTPIYEHTTRARITSVAPIDFDVAESDCAFGFRSGLQFGTVGSRRRASTGRERS